MAHEYEARRKMIMGNGYPSKGSGTGRQDMSTATVGVPTISPDTRATAALICKIAACEPLVAGDIIAVANAIGIRQVAEQWSDDVDDPGVLLAFDAWFEAWDEVIDERRDGREVDESTDARDHNMRRTCALAAAMLEEGWEPS